jgi:murein DD-endopeptidase MepM/ murein hydrolase activator NlpD
MTVFLSLGFFFTLGVSDAPLQRVDASVRGSIEASLVRAEGKNGRSLAAQLARLLAWQGDVVRDVHPDDRIRLIYRQNREPELVALSYHGSAITLSAYLFRGPDGIERFYNSKGRLVEKSMNDSPVRDYVQITEGVQKGPGKRRHHGVDFKAPEGIPIQLPFDASIRRLNWSRKTNGVCVEVSYTNGPAIKKRGRFLHLSKMTPGLKIGQRLKAGALLGRVGSTGRSSAPHLHYEVRGAKGEVFDPFAIHGFDRPQLTSESLAAFFVARNHFSALLEGQPPGI